MKYPLSSVPHSLGTADGYMAKTDKSKGIQFLLKYVNDAPLPDDANTVFIQDSNALFHAMADIPSNFQLIPHRTFHNMPKIINLIFSTDMYQEGLMNDMERERHGSSKRPVIGGQLTNKLADWKNFLVKSQNKSQMVDVMN